MRSAPPLFLLIVACACSNAVSAPTATAPLTIVPAVSLMKAGDQQPLVALQQVPIPAVWTSSNAAILSVDATGLAKAHGHGSVDVVATFEGRSAMVRINVVDNVEGTWTGPGTIDGCSSDGVGFPCTGTLGRTDMMTLRLLQVRDSVTGTLRVGAYPDGPAVGTLAPDGSIVINGTFQDNTGIAVRYSIDTWSGQFEEDTSAIAGRYGVSYRFNDGFLNRFYSTGGTFRITRTADHAQAARPNTYARARWLEAQQQVQLR
jgi:hypothetical protein